MKHLNDKQLVKLLIQGSEKAFEELYIRYKNKLYTFCVFLLKSKDAADDVVQEVFIAVWSNRDKINSNKPLSSYLYTIARNKSFNMLRDSRSADSIDEITEAQHSVSDVLCVEESLILKEYDSILRRALDLLPKRKRDIYRMSLKGGLTYKDIGENLGVSHHTVQANISSSKKFIRDYFLQHV